MSKTHSGKKVVVGLLSAMIGASSAVLWIANSFGSQPAAEMKRRPQGAGASGGSMWKNIDTEIKSKQSDTSDKRGKPAAPW